MKRSVALALSGLGLSAALAAGSGSADLPAYQKSSGVSGNLSSIGSDTLNNLMALWAEGFAKVYPNVNIQIEGKGSSTAPPALIDGTAQLGPMSRAMKSSEIDKFEKKYGYKPTQIRVALDALAVYVNKDNPVKGLTMSQVDAIFSKTRKRGHKDSVETWGQVGLPGDWAASPLSAYGRNSASGTYGFFKEHTLKNGDYKDTVKEQPGSASVVMGVAKDRFGIGYSGMGYATSGVRKVPLAEKDGDPYVTAEPENVLNDTYPLSRFLYIYVNRAPGKPMDPLLREFLTFVVSREGQEVTVKDGFIPLPTAVADEELAKLR